MLWTSLQWNWGNVLAIGGICLLPLFVVASSDEGDNSSFVNQTGTGSAFERPVKGITVNDFTPIFEVTAG